MARRLRRIETTRRETGRSVRPLTRLRDFRGGRDTRTEYKGYEPCGPLPASRGGTAFVRRRPRPLRVQSRSLHMRMRLLTGLAGLCLLLSAAAPARAADDKPAAPTFYVRMKSIENLVA